MNRSPYNLGETLDVARRDFAAQSPMTMAANSDCVYDLGKNSFTVPFLNQKYIVSYPDGLATYGEKEGEAPLIITILLLHYLVKASGAELAGEWVSFKELQGGAIYIEPFRHRAIIPLVRNFGGRLQDFALAAEKLGGQKGTHGDISYIIPIFPRVRLLCILWRGDEEFPPNGNILFDRTANAYLHTEDYAMLSGMTVGALRAALN